MPKSKIDFCVCSTKFKNALALKLEVCYNMRNKQFHSNQHSWMYWAVEGGIHHENYNYSEENADPTELYRVC